ncbi:alkaline proteinase [Myriangium duriaei CBS 260.36]|uniref:Alkaline proteinase n=1 Tax=Myriangium duriaei CBS 260.36 TaxID=1168546 RepID=A0A9P4ME81_9PEZI|nr:alkaline proteinase [Myriangium duriaei CBS 260.36]
MPLVLDRYIITLKPHSDLDEHLAHLSSLTKRGEGLNSHEQSQVFEGVTHRYNFSDFQAYAGHFHSSVVQQLRAHEHVDTVEPDTIMTAAALVTQKDAPVGLSLISHRGLSQDHKGYFYDSSAGEGTYAYVLDTGVDVSNKEFEGRAFNAHLLRKKNGYKDTNGHGTGVAGVIGSKTFGVAKKCKILSVKVMEDTDAPMSDVMLGFDWAVKDINTHKRRGRSVINISLNGEHSPSWNRALDAAARMNVVAVVAAGNDDKDVSQTSPGSSANAITVAATDLHRVRASSSNFGAGITLFAPGVGVQSTAPDGETREFSGTSIAAAHVTGMALYITGIKSFANPRSLKSILQRLATNKVVGDLKGSPNKFAYNNGGSSVGILN